MHLKDPKLLADYMRANDFSQARLARYAGVSRQFVHMLVTTRERDTCTVEVAQRIEEAMRVLPGTLFEAKMSPHTQQRVARRATTKAAS